MIGKVSLALLHKEEEGEVNSKYRKIDAWVNIIPHYFLHVWTILIKYKICTDANILEILMKLGNVGNILLENYWLSTTSYEIILEDLFIEYYPYHF